MSLLYWYQGVSALFPCAKLPLSLSPACPQGTYGQACNSLCRCQNGGSCDPVTGKCLCPPGVEGLLCEEGLSALFPLQSHTLSRHSKSCFKHVFACDPLIWKNLLMTPIIGCASVIPAEFDWRLIFLCLNYSISQGIRKTLCKAQTLNRIWGFRIQLYLISYLSSHLVTHCSHLLNPHRGPTLRMGNTSPCYPLDLPLNLLKVSSYKLILCSYLWF